MSFPTFQDARFALALLLLVARALQTTHDLHSERPISLVPFRLRVGGLLLGRLLCPDVLLRAGHIGLDAVDHPAARHRVVHEIIRLPCQVPIIVKDRHRVVVQASKRRRVARSRPHTHPATIGIFAHRQRANHRKAIAAKKWLIVRCLLHHGYEALPIVGRCEAIAHLFITALQSRQLCLDYIGGRQIHKGPVSPVRGPSSREPISCAHACAASPQAHRLG